SSTCFGRPHPMLTASYAATDLPTFQCRRRPSSRQSSTSRRQRQWASSSRPACSSPPTRWSSEAAGVHHAARRRGGGVAPRGGRAAAGDAGAAGLAGPRSRCFAGFRQGLNEIGYVEGRICSQHIVCCITPYDRFIDELDLPFAGWRIEDDRCVARQTVETGDESRSVASRWEAAPGEDTI